MSNQKQAVSVAGGVRFPGQGVIQDLAGREVDASGPVWRLSTAGEDYVLNWRRLAFQSPELMLATTDYMARLVETQNPASVKNTFNALRILLDSEEFARADQANDLVTASVLVDLLREGRSDAWRLHYVRHWYGWCATFGYPNFSEETALELQRVRIPGNQKGLAVLSADPDEGPLTDTEMASLTAALRAARVSGILSLEELVALWLCLALGPNPLQMALLRVKDVLVIEEQGVPAFVHLQVPRVKKREADVRSSFRRRSLTSEIGSLVLELVERRFARDRRVRGLATDRPKPLFVRTYPRRQLPLELRSEEMSFTARDFGKFVTDAANKLNVPSRLPGKTLHVTCRRLRYTFATRLVREGVTKREIADLLDHTDLQHVQVYFDIKSDIVEKLDKAMAMALAPIAQAFMGKIVPNSGAAVRGDDPAASIAVPDRESAAIREVGTCGEYSFCRLSAPVACYTCVKFQPWIDAPHHLLLDDLLKDRERRQHAGLDGRMVTLMDTTILAIADVIGRIETIKAEAAS